MISDEKFAVSQELMEQAYDYLKDGYEQALNALEEAEAENTKLRKELDAEHALAETLGHFHEQAQDENAKLRELVRYAHECAIHSDHATCDDCRRMNSSCILADRMRELGIEVTP